MDFVDYKTCCRFCLASECVNKVKINKDIRKKFQEATNVELCFSDDYSEFSCAKCVENINTCLAIRSYLIENQNLLQKHLNTIIIKTEDIDAVLQDENFDLPPDNDSIDVDLLQPSIKIESPDKEIPDESLNEEQIDTLEEKVPRKSKCTKKESKTYKEKKKKEKPKARVYKPNKQPCPECGKIINSVNLLKHRKNVHWNEKNYTCDLCGREFFTKYSIMCHLKVHFKLYEVVCDICNAKFTNTGAMIYHKNLRHMKKYLQYCHICGKSFGAKVYFERHMLTHVEERSFVCDIGDCRRSFTSEVTLKTHQKLTHSLPSVTCPVCNKVLKSKLCLKGHMKYHKEPEYCCDNINLETNEVCGRKFITSSLLKLHVNTVHRGIKKYPCTQCESSFTGKNDLKYHVINVHEMRKIKCEFCQGTFGSRAYYTRHIKQSHHELDDITREDILRRIRIAKIEDLFNLKKR